jgi:hypothetical protein
MRLRAGLAIVFLALAVGCGDRTGLEGIDTAPIAKGGDMPAGSSSGGSASGSGGSSGGSASGSGGSSGGSASGSGGSSGGSGSSSGGSASGSGSSGGSASSSGSSGSTSGSGSSSGGSSSGGGTTTGSSSGTDAGCEPVLLISTMPAASGNLLTALEQSSTAFCRVDFLDANSITPTADVLSQYGAVMAYNDNNFPYSDPAGLGDALANYFNAGGRVVIALFADAGYPIGGAFVTENLLLLNPIYVPQAADSFSASDSTQNLAPASPILDGVGSISGTGWHGAQQLQNGGAAVARWASGEALAVVGTVVDARGHERNIVDLNILPTDIATGVWIGDGIALLRNALLYQ